MGQFYPWVKLKLPLILSMVMEDNEFQAIENQVDDIEPQHVHSRPPSCSFPLLQYHVVHQLSVGIGGEVV